MAFEVTTSNVCRWDGSDVWRWNFIGVARYRFGGNEGSRHGPSDEDPFQGVDHDQQLHDWRHGRGQRRDLSNPRIYRSGLSMPVVLVFLSDRCWAREFSSKRIPSGLRRVFSIVIVILGIEMLYKGLSGRI